MNNETILEEAQRITDGDRDGDYGTAEDNFGKIAAYWNVYMEHNDLDIGRILEPKHIAMMMVLMKIAREDFKHKRDNLTDAAGYLRCLAKIQREEG